MVKKRFLLPQEIEVHYIIPTIKRYFSQMMKEQGRKQVEIAKLLEIQEATVSQYLSNKRGHQINFNEAIQSEIRESAKRITNRMTLIAELQRVLHIIRKSGTLCEVHRQFSSIPEECKNNDPNRIGCHS